MLSTDFINRIHEQHLATESFPPTSSVCKFTTRVILLLFPEQSKKKIKSSDQIQQKFDDLQVELIDILNNIGIELKHGVEGTANQFMDTLPSIYNDLLKDVEAILNGDPAARSTYEVIRAYPGFYAMAFYRIANALYKLEVPLLPRVITEYAHSKTGIDIHPGATIAPYFFIDHGTGIVIGETCMIGQNVKIYQGVTLGALSVSKDMASTKRHPTIENDVVIYSGATILGGETTVGAHSIIGGNVWITKSVAPNSIVYHQPQTKVRQQESVS